MRLFAATGVIISDAAQTLGKGTAEPLVSPTRFRFGTHSVTVFFISSGVLIAASFENSRTVWHWGFARFFRRYSGLFAARRTPRCPAGHSLPVMTTTCVIWLGRTAGIGQLH